MYGDTIYGTSEEVARACSMDPKCKAYQYELSPEFGGYGTLCSTRKNDGEFNRFQTCTKP